MPSEPPARGATRRERLGGRVPFPPPAIYLLATLAGWLLHRVWPAPIFSDPASSGPFALLALALSLVIGFLSIREFRRARTPVRPDLESVAVVRSGIFAYSRNPIYLAMALAQVAIGIWLDSWWVVGLVGVSLLLISRVIAGEERYLEARFGEPYRDYMRSVRRWI